MVLTVMGGVGREHSVAHRCPGEEMVTTPALRSLLGRMAQPGSPISHLGSHIKARRKPSGFLHIVAGGEQDDESYWPHTNKVAEFVDARSSGHQWTLRFDTLPGDGQPTLAIRFTAGSMPSLEALFGALEEALFAPEAVAKPAARQHARPSSEGTQDGQRRHGGNASPAPASNGPGDRRRDGRRRDHRPDCPAPHAADGGGTAFRKRYWCASAPATGCGRTSRPLRTTRRAPRCLSRSPAPHLNNGEFSSDHGHLRRAGTITRPIDLWVGKRRLPRRMRVVPKNE